MRGAYPRRKRHIVLWYIRRLPTAEGAEEVIRTVEQAHRNEVHLTGAALGAPEFSHAYRQERFYRFPLRLTRLSGQCDEVTVLLHEDQAAGGAVVPGARLDIAGQLRSYNNRSGVGRRLVLTVFAQSLGPGDGEDHNLVRLAGALCKAPLCRSTPLGRRICDMMLAVNRRCGRTDYIPCIAWGALARQIGAMAVGEHVAFSGRMQSRLYYKRTEEGVQARTAYEVSVMCLEEETV